ncbi:hypothetical protein I4U23_014641 [Adineta vaga]|nr:hypothetical protein I4U23_014641 [Adineta vaga]
MSNNQGIKLKKHLSLLNYVEKFIDKRDKHLKKLEEKGIISPPLARFDKNSIVIETDDKNHQLVHLNNRIDQLDSVSNVKIDPPQDTVGTNKQEVFLHLPISDTVDIQIYQYMCSVQQKMIKIFTVLSPTPPEHSSISRSSPYTNQSIFYNKYIPVTYRPQPSHQRITHYHSDVPITSQSGENDECALGNDSQRNQRCRKESVNRYIEHQNTHTAVEVEFIRLPVMRLNPEEYYRRSNELAKLDSIRSSMYEANTLQWRI